MIVTANNNPNVRFYVVNLDHSTPNALKIIAHQQAMLPWEFLKHPFITRVAKMESMDFMLYSFVCDDSATDRTPSNDIYFSFYTLKRSMENTKLNVYNFNDKSGGNVNMGKYTLTGDLMGEKLFSVMFRFDAGARLMICVTKKPNAEGGMVFIFKVAPTVVDQRLTLETKLVKIVCLSKVTHIDCAEMIDNENLLLEVVKRHRDLTDQANVLDIVVNINSTKSNEMGVSEQNFMADQFVVLSSYGHLFKGIVVIVYVGFRFNNETNASSSGEPMTRVMMVKMDKDTPRFTQLIDIHHKSRDTVPAFVDVDDEILGVLHGGVIHSFQKDTVKGIVYRSSVVYTTDQPFSNETTFFI